MAKGKFASSGVVVGQTPATQWERKLQNQKGNSVTMGVNIPRQTEGAVGDITVREIDTLGIRCYIKTNSGWYDINTMQAAIRTEWIPMVLINDWTADATFPEPAYFKDEHGFVHLSGAVDDQDTAVSVLGDDIAILPVGFRPRKSVFRLVIREQLSQLQSIRIQGSGIIDCVQAYDLVAAAGASGDEIGVNTTKAAYFDGISFYAGQTIIGSGGGTGSGGEGGSGSGGGGAGA